MLDDFTDEQLQAEVERREEIARQESMPKQLETIVLAPLQQTCQEYINLLSAGGHDSPDLREDIFEVAVEMFFGKSVWEWIEGQ